MAYDPNFVGATARVTSLDLLGSTSGVVNILAYATSANYSLILPQTQGVGALTNDGSGNLSWSPSSLSVGAFDGEITPSDNGLTFTSGILYAQSASATEPGMVNTTAQTFVGDKTFSNPSTTIPAQVIVQSDVHGLYLRNTPTGYVIPDTGESPDQGQVYSTGTGGLILGAAIGTGSSATAGIDLFIGSFDTNTANSPPTWVASFNTQAHFLSGTSANPGITFLEDGGSGFQYDPGTHTVSISVQGNTVANFRASAMGGAALGNRLTLGDTTIEPFGASVGLTFFNGVALSAGADQSAGFYYTAIGPGANDTFYGLDILINTAHMTTNIGNNAASIVIEPVGVTGFTCNLYNQIYLIRDTVFGTNHAAIADNTSYTGTYGLNFATTNPSFFAGSLLTGSNLVFQAVSGGLQFQSGSDARVGQATLVAGTVTISNASVTANTRVLTSVSTPGGVQGSLSYTTVAATSLTINSSNVADTSTVDYVLYEVN